MKKIVIGCLMVLSMMFSGCLGVSPDTYKEVGETFIKEHSLDTKVTYFCYDVIDKKDCPNTLMQYDINLLPYIPTSSRFCFGFSEVIEIPQGMLCIKRDFVK